MADFQIIAPDGKKYKVSGETPEGAHAALMKHLGQTAQPAPQAASEQQSTPRPAQPTPQQPAPQPQQQQVAPTPQIEQGAFGQAATAMVNDINAGFQGVNPVSVQKNAQQEMPVGTIATIPGSNEQYVDMDGERVPLDRFKKKDYITHRGEDGAVYVYRRTPEMDENALASVGRVLGYGIAGGPGATIKQAAKPATATEKAASIGVTPSLGMRGPAGARVAAAGEATAITAGPVIRDNQRAVSEIADAAKNISQSAGSSGGIVDGGQALVDGANYFKTATKNQANALYRRVDRFIKPATEVDTSNTRALLEDIGGVFQGKDTMGKQSGATEVSGLLEDLSSATTWEQMKRFRSRLMESTRAMSDTLVNVPQAEKKRLVSAITQDMEAAATKAGPQAAAAWKQANEFYSKRADVITGALGKIFKADAPEKAFLDVFAMAGETSRANIASLSKIKSSMRPDDWGVVVSTVIDRMGKASPGAQDAAGGAFSANTFLTNWNKISKQSQSLLFKGKGLPADLSKNLTTLAEVVETAKNANTQINHSRTGNVVASAAMGAGAIADMGATATLGVMAHLSARTLSQPIVVGALARVAKGGSPKTLFNLAKGNTQASVELATALRLSGVQPSQ